MEFNQTVMARRSLRAYEEGKTVEKAQIEELIRFAQMAPSWKNSQTGRYYVVMSPEMLEKVRKDCLPEFNQKNSANAPALIITAFEKTRSGFTREGVAENEVGEGWGCYDLGLQNENLVLKAKDMGLDTLIMGIRNSEKLREYLEIPASQEVVSVIAVGYGAIKPEMPVRKNVEEFYNIFYILSYRHFRFNCSVSYCDHGDNFLGCRNF